MSPSSEGSETDPYYYVYGYEGTDVAAAKSTDNYETYGVLYNWPAVMTEGICPSGWHIPSDGEWQTMEISLGMSESEAAARLERSPVGDHMKSTSGWNDMRVTALIQADLLVYQAATATRWFRDYGYDGYWWSASESGSYSWIRLLDTQRLCLPGHHYRSTTAFLLVASGIDNIHDEMLYLLLGY